MYILRIHWKILELAYLETLETKQISTVLYPYLARLAFLTSLDIFAQDID